MQKHFFVYENVTPFSLFNPVQFWVCLRYVFLFSSPSIPIET